MRARDFSSDRHLVDPDDANGLQKSQSPIRPVEAILEPSDCLGCTILVVMMVVVPTFTERDYRKYERIPALVPSTISLFPPHMSERVDGERAVIECDCARKESPHDHLDGIGVQLRTETPSEKSAESREADWARHEVDTFVEPHELRTLFPIPDPLFVRRMEFLAHDPADMRPEESAPIIGMDIVFRIGLCVMVPMVRCPPDGTFLHGECRRERHHPPGKPRPQHYLESPVRKIPMVESRDEEHPDDVEDDCSEKCSEAETDEEGPDEPDDVD